MISRYNTIHTQKGRDNSSRHYAYFESYEIVKTSLTLLDLPKHHCDDSTENRLDVCTVKYLEASVGSRMPWERKIPGFESGRHNCSKPEQYSTYSALINDLQHGSEDDYYLKTGCLGPCKRSKFDLKQRMVQV